MDSVSQDLDKSDDCLVLSMFMKLLRELTILADVPFAIFHIVIFYIRNNFHGITSMVYDLVLLIYFNK